jgi:gluconate 2-dehydrogenase gamma chain
MTHSASRRAFVETSGTLLSGVWLNAHLPAIQAAAIYARRALARRAPFDVLTPEEARELDAVAARIIPTDDTPGAREAGVIYFMDKALGSFAQPMLQPLRAGLGDLRQAARARAGAAARFSSLGPEDQDVVLEALPQSDFFQTVRFLTVAGMYGDPSYGGNRDATGWKLLDFDGAHAYQPPFGHYDREYRERGG